MFLLIFALPNSAFTDFNGIVYNTSEEFSKSQLDVDSQILSNITDTVKLYDNPYMEQTVLEFSQKRVDVYTGINILDEYQNKLDNYMDFVYHYMFDYWNGFSASQSLVKLDLFHKMNLKQYDQQSVYKIGHPDTGNVLGTADPSPSEHRLFLRNCQNFKAIIFYSHLQMKKKKISSQIGPHQNEENH